MSKIAFTGMTGKIGTELTKLLDKEKILSKLLVRNPDKLSSKNDNFDINTFDFYQEDYSGIFYGCDKLFLLVPSLLPDFIDIIEKFVNQAKQEGIQKVVFISAMGIEDADESELFRAERKIINLGISYVILRPNWFMQNFNTTFAAGIKENKKILLPAGDGKIGFIDVRDIAQMSLNTLMNDDINNAEFTLTGSGAIDHFEVATHISEAINQQVEYEPISDEHYSEILTANNWDATSIRSIIWLFQSIRRGDAARISGDFKKVIGKEPIKFASYAQDYFEVWK